MSNDLTVTNNDVIDFSYLYDEDAPALAYNVNIELMGIAPVNYDKKVYYPDTATYHFILINDDHMELDEDALIDIFWERLKVEFMNDYNLNVDEDITYHVGVTLTER
jgi:hypothetical protein